jgi:hypothetical protein
MAWNRGPLPADTYGWGAVVPTYLANSGGFFFADFQGAKVVAIRGGYKGADRELAASEVAWYDNSLTLPPTGATSRGPTP